MLTDENSFSTDQADKTCLNCDTPISHIYCSNCGQMYETEEISVKSMYRSWYKKQRHHVEVFLFTTRNLFLRPGVVVQEYWAGKKKKYYNPFNYLAFITGIMAFVMLKFGSFDPEIATANISKMYASMGIEIPEENKGGLMALQWMQGHFNLVMILFIPFYAMAMRIWFRKRDFNWGKMMIPTMYMMAMYFLGSILLVPFLDYNNPFKPPMSLVNFGWMFGIWSWIIGRTFRLTWWRSILAAVGIYALGQILFTGVIIAVMLVVLIIALGVIMLIKAFR